MHTKQPLKEVLSTTREHWDNAEVRPAVRRNFQRVIECRTPALGAEVYASETERKVVYHTCKSRACPSCGYRMTQLWQREQWADLPDIPYAGVVLTMPDALWPIFQTNRHLLHDLPVLGAAVLQQWVKARFGVRVLIMVVPHTFGRRLNFNAHLHILASSLGLSEAAGNVKGVHFDKQALMHMWRYAVITYLRQALATKVLKYSLVPEQLRALLQKQYERWWNVDVAKFHSKRHFLRYAGRYVRRPPIAQHRFTSITNEAVEFSTKDLRKKQVVRTRYSPADFVAKLAEHVPDRYRHAIRYFGLLAPRSKGQMYPTLFLLLQQITRQRPRRLKWAYSIEKSFGANPLIDHNGKRMVWTGRIKSDPSYHN